MAAFARKADFCRKCSECPVGKRGCDLIENGKLLFSHKNLGFFSYGNDKRLLWEIRASCLKTYGLLNWFYVDGGVVNTLLPLLKIHFSSK